MLVLARVWDEGPPPRKQHKWVGWPWWGLGLLWAEGGSKEWLCQSPWPRPGTDPCLSWSYTGVGPVLVLGPSKRRCLESYSFSETVILVVLPVPMELENGINGFVGQLHIEDCWVCSTVYCVLMFGNSLWERSEESLLMWRAEWCICCPKGSPDRCQWKPLNIWRN